MEKERERDREGERERERERERETYCTYTHTYTHRKSHQLKEGLLCATQWLCKQPIFSLDLASVTNALTNCCKRRTNNF